MVANSVLRDNARGQLGRNIFGEMWLMMLLACVIVAALEGVAGITYIGTIIVLGPLSYGLCRVLVKRVRNEGKVELGDLFKGFTEAFTDSLLLGLLQSIFIFLWSLLLVIPGIVKSYSYAMSSFIQQDSPNKNWRECLDASSDLMNGNKMDLFLLDLSFIGWYLVGALCLGIGTLFVIPYHQMARANFYMALVAEHEDAAARRASQNVANGQNADRSGAGNAEAPAYPEEPKSDDPFADVHFSGEAAPAEDVSSQSDVPAAKSAAEAEETAKPDTESAAEEGSANDGSAEDETKGE